MAIVHPLEAIPVIMENGISEDWFTTHDAANIFTCIMAFCRKNGIARFDILAFSQFFRDKTGTVDGGLVLDSLVDASPPLAHLGFHIDEARKDFKRRRGRILCHEYSDRFKDKDENPDELASELASGMISITDAAISDVGGAYERDKQLRERAKQHGRIGLPSRFADIQRIKGGYSPDEGECVVISGRTSHGKTLLAMNEAVHWATDYGAPVGVVELDMSAQMLQRRTAAQIGRVNSFKFDYGNATEEDERGLDAGWNELMRLPIFFSDRRMTCDDIIAYGTMLHMKRGIKFLVVDHLTKIKMTHYDMKLGPRWAIGEWVTRIQDFGKRFNICTIILSQSNTRDTDKFVDKAPPISGLGSLKEAGSIEENADGVLTINKKPGEPLVNYTGDNPFWDMVINIAKNRARGPTGTAPIMLWSWRQTFIDHGLGVMHRDEWLKSRQGNRH